METNGKNGKGKWIALVTSILSFIGGVVLAAYIVGQRTGTVLELSDWKKETAPRIERMDAKGTNSFEIFHDEYLRTQKRQEDELERLRQEIHDKQVLDLKERILTLERK